MHSYHASENSINELSPLSTLSNHSSASPLHSLALKLPHTVNHHADDQTMTTTFYLSVHNCRHPSSERNYKLENVCKSSDGKMKGNSGKLVLLLRVSDTYHCTAAWN